MITIKLSQEVEFEGKKYTELSMDYDKLTGRDIMSAEKEASVVAGRPVVDVDKTYQAVLAAKASGVVSDMIFNLPAKDFVSVVGTAQDFLLGI